MMNRHVVFLVSIISLLVLNTASAQSSSVRSVTLDSCLVLARANSPLLKQAGLSLRSAGLVRQELTTTALPQLRFSAGASYAPGTRRFGYDPAVSNMGEFGSRVILEQPLYDGGLRHLKTLQADMDISKLTKEQQLAIRDLELEVRQWFIECLRAQQEVGLREQAVRELTEYLDLVNRLSAGGGAAHTDVLRTQVELSTASTTLSQSNQSLMEARYQLAGFIGDPSDTSFTVSDSPGESGLIQIDSADLAGVMDTTRNLELSIAGLEYNRTASEIKEARKARLPTMSFVADVGWLTSRENLTLPASERYNGLGYSVGISVDMPLFDWGGHRLRVQQKQLAAESVRLQFDIVRRAYETEYRSALARLAPSQSQLTVLRDAIRQAEDNFLLTKSKYAAGGAVASEVLSAQQLLTESRIAKLETLSDIQMGKAKILRLAGN